MKQSVLILFLTCILSQAIAQTDSTSRSPFVDYAAFLELATEVQPHRAERLISLEEFIEMGQKEDVIILDTRSKEMFDAKHVKGAVHLSFSDFTQMNLEALIHSKQTRILIYCNNNFEDDQVFFATKAYIPPPRVDRQREITLALNIPTYINLSGYGYKNVYELSELISVFDSRIEFEGTAVTGDE